MSADGNAPLRVWREGSLDTHIVMSIGDRTIEVASSTERNLRDPSVARGGDTLLVTWRDLPKLDWVSVPGYRIYARRFALDGTPVDAQPLLVSKDDAQIVDVELGTATAFDGVNFVAIWSAPFPRAARISPAGALLAATPFELN